MGTSKDYWDRIYETRPPEAMSWTQAVPATSLALMREAVLSTGASVIDIGGGDGRLVDFLLEAGFADVTVLDISERSLERARRRLGAQADRVRWVVGDVTEYEPDRSYDLWHDRAAFHFLTTTEQIVRYLSVATAAVRPGGHAVIGTFAIEGPTTCSGLPVRRYSEDSLDSELRRGFSRVRCVSETHATPFQTQQDFLFCSFRRVDGVPSAHVATS